MAEIPTTTAATFCATVVDEWVRCGITDAVASPGSRSTPMALALAADNRIRLHIHHDERSAGFIALGLATATGRPAPVLTTSGTATVELHPAVAEAHHGRIPMICCTADRPPELWHVGAPQTVDQIRLYGEAVRWFVDLGVPDPAATHAWRSVAARVVAEATGSPAGPVQWNLPFRDPLVGQPGELPSGRSEGRPWHHAERHVGTPDRAQLASLASEVAGHRGVIVAGAVGPGGVASQAVHTLARVLGWPVFADPRSGCRTPEGTTVSYFDALLRNPRFASDHTPEVVIQLGQPPASKVLGQWLAASDAHHVLVDPDGAWLDPDRQAALVIEADPAEWCHALVEALKAGEFATDEIDERWIESWAAADAAADTALASTLARYEQITEPTVARELVAALPSDSWLVVSSSMPIRDIEWFTAARSGLRVVANRGANGIDGVVSTAVGIALTGVPTALLIGDVAFLHDTNGLLGLAKRDVDLTIVVIDNRGGGIFSFLPQADLVPGERFERLFGTPHDVELGLLAQAHGIPLTRVEKPGSLEVAVRQAHAAGGVSIVLVETGRDANVEVHRELNDAVIRAVG